MSFRIDNGDIRDRSCNRYPSGLAKEATFLVEGEQNSSFYHTEVRVADWTRNLDGFILEYLGPSGHLLALGDVQPRAFNWLL